MQALIVPEGWNQHRRFAEGGGDENAGGKRNNSLLASPAFIHRCAILSGESGLQIEGEHFYARLVILPDTNKEGEGRIERGSEEKWSRRVRFEGGWSGGVVGDGGVRG